jgi:carbon starvation protein
MNALTALLLGLVVAFVGYRFYAGWVDRRIIRPQADRVTPAKMYMDGVDFVPTSRNVLFGYQFKSIAGAAPVVGAIVAAQWGWLPAMIWLFAGVFFIGWVHDYTSAMVSLRNDGLTFGGLSYRLISPRARLLLLAFIYFYLLLVAGAFGAVVAGLLANIGAAFLGLVFLVGAGLLAGQMIYRWRRDIILTTLVTVAIAVGGILLGTRLPAKSILSPAVASQTWLWAILTFLFCYLGATLPIWRFAQPINYVSFFIVFLGLIGGAIGVVVGRPQFTLPAFTTAVIPIGPIWPILPVTLACGAISGWHSLVSSSGTARQLESETDARPVAAGSMFAEMLLGLLALVTASVAYAGYGAFRAALGGPGGAGAVFAAGLSRLLGFLGIPVAFGKTFAAVLIVVLAITVMQLVVRFMRVATAELVGDRFPALRNMHVATLVACVLGMLLVLTGWWQYLWILFGGANQLMASLALLIVTLWLVSKRQSAAFVFVPMVFMFITTIAALGYTAYSLIAKVAAGKVAGSARVGNGLMAVVALFLVAAALVLAADGWQAFRRYRAQRANVAAEQT